MPGPLDGIRVFDLTLWMVGPWGSMQLGALGADVIHIEQPNVDPRTLGGGVPPSIKGTSVGYITWNMNRRSIFLDLKEPQDRATAYQLLRTSDVFLMNMRPGVAERLGVDYETVAELNPQIIYCAVTGWGETGPMAQRPGADGYALAFTGFWSNSGQEGGRPEHYRHHTQFDASTGNYAAQAILMALLARKRTGRGQKIEINMLQAGSALQTERIGEYLIDGRLAQPQGSAAIATAPDQAFLCEDQLWVGVSVTSEPEWAAFCKVIGHPELIEDERFRSNHARVDHRKELAAILEPIFSAKPQYYWMMWLTRAGVPCGYPLRFEQLRFHQQARENEYIIDVDTAGWGPVTTGGPPWHLSKTPARWFETPIPGVHTGEILDELERQRRPAVREGV
jgi:crotonobetainyl-CoA:carnitine CoA-transferase CaiB-like acyl-CoA transferase